MLIKNVCSSKTLSILLLLISSVFCLSFLKSSNLENISKELSTICDKTLPAIVMLKIYSSTTQEGVFDYKQDYFFQKYFSNQKSQPESDSKYLGFLGSGFIVDPNGYIITCHHVIDHPEVTIYAILHNGKKYKASIIGKDSKIDLAVLKIESSNLPFLKFADSDKTKIGSFVIALGTPLTSYLQSTATFGFISAKQRRLSKNEVEDFLQTDTALNPGNSGGPLINTDGQVIGLNSNIMTASYLEKSSSGLSFAVSSNLVRKVYRKIIEKKELNLPVLGIVFCPFKQHAKNHLTIAKIMPDSPAEKAGIQTGDQILKINGIKLYTFTDFKTQIYSMQRTTLPLIISRKNKKINLFLKL